MAGVRAGINLFRSMWGFSEGRLRGKEPVKVNGDERVIGIGGLVRPPPAPVVHRPSLILAWRIFGSETQNL
jgi:hypothetical protein